MALINLKCPNCSGSIQMDDSKETGFCLYCGSKFLVNDEIQRILIEHSGSVEINRQNESQKRINDLASSVEHVSNLEYKKTCKKCGKIWYTSKARESDLVSRLNSSFIADVIGNMFSRTDRVALDKQIATMELQKLRTCPNCRSSDFIVN